MKRLTEYAAIIILCISSIVLIALQIKMLGATILLTGVLTLPFCSKQFSKYFALLYLCVGILGITSITTDISYLHFLTMGAALSSVLVIPYIFSKYFYEDGAIKFKFHHGRNWYTTEILYIIATAVVAYFLIPFLLKNTGSYKNWTVDPGLNNLLRLFIGTNGLGIWDELFFISTVLGVLRRFLTFSFANIAQAVMFTSFLYELGFRGWAFGAIFIFALIQGYIFKKTESLFYVITIHLTLDFILYLALIQLHHPDWIKLFLI